LRQPIVAANWKMHETAPEAGELAREVRAKLEGGGRVEVVLCPPFTALHAVAAVLEGGSIALGAQNVHWENEGPFTGEISPRMLRDAGCRYVIIGHSERRTGQNESDEAVRRKVGAALAAGLRPIVCVGETLAEREGQRTHAVLERQVERGLAGLGAELAGMVVAYEPVWAIGTGRTASPEQAQEAHVFLRDLLRGIAGESLASATRIAYGGSVNPSNAAELFGMPDVDGGLIGGASLSAESFASIVHAA
jgi:triosephosphate isomerase